MLYALMGWLALAGVPDETFLEWTSEITDRKELPASIGTQLAPNELARLAEAKPPMPFRELTVGVRLDDGTLWVGSSRGLMYSSSKHQRWRLFHSRRWLPSDQVQGLAVDAEGGAWVQTPAGIAHIYRRPTTLDKKMDGIHAMLRKHHVRLGLVGSIDGPTPGRITEEWVQHSSDNDGLWTSIYVGAETFRYGATGDESARQNAWESLRALMFLEDVTGIPGYVARSIYPGDIDFKPAERHGGEWHLTPDKKWWWKGDTSSDELDGHYFAYAAYYDLAATEEQRATIRQYVARITDHILDHGYYYVGPSGKPTTWGVWSPEKLNQDLEWFDDRGLNSLELLSHLKVAEHVTGDAKYAKAAKELIERHSYAINTVDQKLVWPPQAVNHSDDELAFLAYWPLLIYEHDPVLRRIYLASVERSWQIERPELSPLFNYIYAACRQASEVKDPFKRPEKPYLEPTAYDHEASIEWFRDVPGDLFEWTIKNGDRQDLGERAANRFDRPRSRFVLPVSERRVMRWNGDPYELDGGGEGRSRDDGAAILLAYWMGRYYRFID